jgi:hypothetical protein
VDGIKVKKSPRQAGKKGVNVPSAGIPALSYLEPEVNVSGHADEVLAAIKALAG